MGLIKEPDPKKFMTEKLAGSGLIGRDIDSLGIVPYTAEESKHLKGITPGAGFMIPYHSAGGTKQVTYRFRYALPKRDAGGRDIRYSQPVGSLPEVYLPRLNKISWDSIQREPKCDLLITEGELKAACAVKAGFYCIGLGGVYNFGSAKLGMEMLPSLEAFVWVGRRVYICYDSDSATNLEVCRASNRLARLLSFRGADVYVVQIPGATDANGKPVKVGLDDLLVPAGSHTPDANLLQPLLENAAQWFEQEELFLLNTEVAYIRQPSSIAILPTQEAPAIRLVSVNEFRKELFYPRTIVRNVEGKTIVKRAADEWFGSKMRREHAGLTFAPGQPMVTADNYLNVWSGWPNTPMRGNVKPWLEFMDHVFSPEQQRERDWFLDWLAYPIKYAGTVKSTKMNSAVLLWGQQGTGKSSVGATMERVYGAKYCATPGQGELDSDFNGWLADKQFIIAEEITGNEARKHVSKLKQLVTGNKFFVNKKGIERFEYPNAANFLFVSNYANALHLDSDDRRYFVHQLNNKLPSNWWQQYVRWLDEENGAAHLHQWFIDRDTSNFDPNGPALVTNAHADVVMAGMSELDVWVHDLNVNPDAVLRKGAVVLPFRLWTADELYDLYLSNNETAAGAKFVTRPSLGRALGRAGFHKVNRNEAMPLKNGTRRPVWAIRNPDDVRMMQGEALRLYNGEREAFDKTVKFK